MRYDGNLYDKAMMDFDGELYYTIHYVLCVDCAARHWT